MTLPLDGLLVVAIEQAVAAPMCTLRLADSGARVIKIERDVGDTARHYDAAVHGTSAYFAWLNRGKESVVLDLKASADVALVKKMLSKADIFIQNLAPGAAARLGLGSSELSAQHSRLIAVDIVGYGGDTRYRSMRAYDMLVQAESGLCSVTGTPDTPAKVGVSIADICTGMNAHAAILEALMVRERTGRGVSIEIAMFDGLAEWMTVPLMHYEFMGRVAPRVGLSHAQIYPYGSFHCSDGVILIAIQNADEWRRFCIGILKQSELVGDTRFADNPSRLSNREALDKIILRALSHVTCADLTAELERLKLAWGRCSTIPDLAKHPALRRISVRAPGGAIFASVASPLRQSLKVKAVPSLGEHSERIWAEFTTDKAESIP